MNTEQIELLKRLEDVLQESTVSIIASFTEFYIMDSLVWAAIGLLLTIMSLKIKYDADGDFLPDYAIKWLPAGVGVAIIGAHLPTLLAPKAQAIRELLGRLASF